jgi:hypothetical protein
VRAYQLTGDPWQEDPACYLLDEEIGVQESASRLQVVPFNRSRAQAIKQQGQQGIL